MLDDGYILSIESSTDYKWVQTFGSEGISIPTLVCRDDSDNIYMTGGFAESYEHPTSGELVRGGNAAGRAPIGRVGDWPAARGRPANARLDGAIATRRARPTARRAPDTARKWRIVVGH